MDQRSGRRLIMGEGMQPLHIHIKNWLFKIKSNKNAALHVIMSRDGDKFSKFY